MVDGSNTYLRVFIDARFVLDVFGSVGISQSAQCLIVIVVCGPYVGDHDCLGVAAQ